MIKNDFHPTRHWLAKGLDHVELAGSVLNGNSHAVNNDANVRFLSTHHDQDHSNGCQFDLNRLSATMRHHNGLNRHNGNEEMTEDFTKGTFNSHGHPIGLENLDMNGN